MILPNIHNKGRMFLEESEMDVNESEVGFTWAVSFCINIYWTWSKKKNSSQLHTMWWIWISMVLCMGWKYVSLFCHPIKRHWNWHSVWQQSLLNVLLVYFISNYSTTDSIVRPSSNLILFNLLWGYFGAASELIRLLWENRKEIPLQGTK